VPVYRSIEGDIVVLVGMMQLTQLRWLVRVPPLREEEEEERERFHEIR